jgi:LPS export ABC transporter protein LptC
MRSTLFWTLALLVIAGCRDGATTPSPTEMQDMPVDQIMYGIEHKMTNAGIRRAVLYGDTAYMHQSGARIEVVGVRMTFFNEIGRESAQLTSETGTYELRAGTMIAKGNAVLRMEEDGVERILETEQLHFDVNGDRLWSDVPVVMREGTQVVHGTSFTSDGRFQNVRVQSAQTSGTPQPSSPGGVSF